LQSARARKSRGKVSPDGQTPRQIIERIVKLNPGAEIQEQWEAFFIRLEQEALAPSLVHDTTDASKESVEFHPGAKPRKMSFARFKNIISEIRREKNHDSPAVDI
jgi:hypothetical protein